MPKFIVTVTRTETYLAETPVEAASAKEAQNQIASTLASCGWGYLTWKSEYDECTSEVTGVRVPGVHVNLITPMTIPDNSCHADWDRSEHWDDDNEGTWWLDCGGLSGLWSAGICGAIDPEQLDQDDDYKQNQPRAYDHFVAFRLWVSLTDDDKPYEWPLDPGEAVTYLTMDRATFFAAILARIADACPS